MVHRAFDRRRHRGCFRCDCRTGGKERLGTADTLERRPRYTFTAIEELPREMIVPHGESVTWQVKLADDSRWKPDSATIEIEGMLPNVAELSDDGYTFELPARTQQTEILVRAGDFYQSVMLEPKIRPELVAANAQMTLPEYLQLPDPVQRDVRSGTVSVVEGSKLTVAATASRALNSAEINQTPVTVSDASFGSDEVNVEPTESGTG